MLKVLSFRLQQCFGPWTMLLVKGSINKYGKGDQWIMKTCCRLYINSVSARLPCYLWKAPLKRDFLDTYLTTCFGVRKFKNTSAVRVIFLLKLFKVECKFRKCKQNWENIFRFWDNCIWKGCFILSLLRRHYLLSAVNGLTNSPVWTWVVVTVIHNDEKRAVV